jgi:HEAT repeat protein
LVQVIGDPDAELRCRTARALGRVWPRDQITAKACLRQALDDQDDRVALMAACALSLLGEADEPVVDGVLTALASEDEDLRGEAFRAVSKLKEAADEVGAERVLALVDHWKYTWSVPMTLSMIGRPAVPALVVLLSHEKPRVRSAAAGALGRLGADAILALPSLTATSKGDGNKNVRLAAKNAMAAITKKGRHFRP